MTKTLVDIDDDLMRRAMTATGQTTKKDTVRMALEQSVRRSAALAYIDALEQGISRDLDDPEVVREAQR